MNGGEPCTNMSPQINSLDREIYLLPKVELHAHLSGCFRASLLKEFLDIIALKESSSQNLINKYLRFLNEVIQNRVGDLNLEKCFFYFEAMKFIIQHQQHLLGVVSGYCPPEIPKESSVLYHLIESVLLDFERDHVIYLELRLTPKSIPSINVSKKDYLDLVITAIKKIELRGKIKVRLILSLNREFITSAEIALAAINELLELSRLDNDNYIVGVDISGDPRKGDIEPVLKYLDQLRGQKPSLINHESTSIVNHLTIHAAEIEGAERETNLIFDVGPERLGHLCYLNQEQQERLKNDPKLFNTAVEICPTSNLNTLGIKLVDHHFGILHPFLAERISICTDDTGLFNTTLSDELISLANAFNLSIEHLRALQFSALQYSFCSDSLKQQLSHHLEQ